VNTFIYLGMLAVISTGMFTWGRILFQRAQKEQGTTPPGQGDTAEQATSQPSEGKTKLSKGKKQSAGGTGCDPNRDKAA
jgi:cytoskeletal protein RodZ